MVDYEKNPKYEKAYKEVYAIMKDFLSGFNQKLKNEFSESELEKMTEEATKKVFNIYAPKKKGNKK